MPTPHAEQAKHKEGTGTDIEAASLLNTSLAKTIPPPAKVTIDPVFKLTRRNAVK